ncbi:MAG TPA: BatD family protein [Paludibacter sp.]|nr:BatD family protein [Paludibacter sp.]
MRKYCLMLFLFVALAQTGLWAQKITVNARLDSTVLRIGEQTHLTFEVSQQPNQKVIMPIFSDTIKGGLEMVEPVKTDTLKSADGHIQVTQHYVVTAFEDSLLYIPPFPFVSNGDTVWSKSLSLKVVQPFKIDTASNQLADIKPVMEPKYDWLGLLLKVLIVLGIGGLLVLFYFLYRKYFEVKPALDVKSQELLLPAHVVALNYLDKIKQEKAWQQGRSKEYHTELTDVIRSYIERMFNINSLEMTSEEILDQFRLMRMEQKSVYLSLQQILKLADLVKFAKWDATPDEHELSLLNAYLFVNQTKIEDVKPLEEIKNEESKEHK